MNVLTHSLGRITITASSVSWNSLPVISPEILIYISDITDVGHWHYRNLHVPIMEKDKIKNTKVQDENRDDDY